VNEFQVSVLTERLGGMLSLLRAQYLSYQTSHWQVVGKDFYESHLLFQRLYEAVQGEIDGTAEKLVGLVGSQALNLEVQIELVEEWCERWAGIPDHHARALRSERDAQVVFKNAYDEIKAAQAMTLGLDDFLMATASAHDTNAYLLQQILQVPGDKVASLVGKRFASKKTAGLETLDLKPLTELALDLAAVAGPGKGNSPKAIEGFSPRHVSRDAVAADDFYEMQARAVYLAQQVKSAFMGISAFLQDVRTQRKFASPASSDSGAPSAEGHFFPNPRFRETRQFGESGALSNIKKVVQNVGPINDLTKKELKPLVKDVKNAPPTPLAVSDKLPGGESIGTLTRLMVDTEDPTTLKDKPGARRASRLSSWTFLGE
jgi:DNA-binding ferritin-like protein